MDFLEQDYNLRPTPIRAMRDKYQFDYGNAQSPSKRLSTRTPRRRKESTSISENVFLDESPGQQSNVESTLTLTGRRIIINHSDEETMTTANL